MESAFEADMALVYGLGFPPFRGGLFRWLDEVGLKQFFAMAKPRLRTWGRCMNCRRRCRRVLIQTKILCPCKEAM